MNKKYLKQAAPMILVLSIILAIVLFDAKNASAAAVTKVSNVSMGVVYNISRDPEHPTATLSAKGQCNTAGAVVATMSLPNGSYLTNVIKCNKNGNRFTFSGKKDI